MTIEQTIEIPEYTAGNPVVLQFLKNQRPFMELRLPRELPAGKARVAVTVTPERPAAKRETAESLCGAAKESPLTLARFMEMQREDRELENEYDNRLRGAR